MPTSPAPALLSVRLDEVNPRFWSRLNHRVTRVGNAPMGTHLILRKVPNEMKKRSPERVNLGAEAHYLTHAGLYAVATRLANRLKNRDYPSYEPTDIEAQRVLNPNAPYPEGSHAAEDQDQARQLRAALQELEERSALEFVGPFGPQGVEDYLTDPVIQTFQFEGKYLGFDVGGHGL